MFIKCYNTGSDGNAFYISFNPVTNILIELGVNVVTQRSPDINLSKLSGVFITHNHGDHIDYLESFVTRYPQVPLFMTKGTYDTWLSKIKKPMNKLICSKAPINILKCNVELPFTSINYYLNVEAIKTYHDSVEPCCFMFTYIDDTFPESEFYHLWFITDTGKIPTEFSPDIDDYVIIEANYDERLINMTSYKDIRTISDNGHLSIQTVYKLIKANPQVKWWGLIHGSTSTLDSESDKIFKEFNNVERITAGYEKDIY